jgi:hypothetical protein
MLRLKALLDLKQVVLGGVEQDNFSGTGGGDRVDQGRPDIAARSGYQNRLACGRKAELRSLILFARA